MKNKLPLFVVVLVILVLVSIGVISAQGNPFGAGNAGGFEASELPVQSPVLSKAEQAASLAYWTPERDAAARPVVMVDFNADGGIDREGLRDAKEVAGQSTRFEAGAANPNAEALARSVYAEEWAAAETAAAEGPAVVEGTSEVFTGYVIKESHFHKWYPHKFVGRFKFTNGSGGTSYCSGTAISGNNMVTAAHCVFDNNTNTWNTNMTFTPAYRNGAAPYGVFPTSSCWIWPAFIALPASYSISTWAPLDMSVCDMGLNSTGKTLNYMVGWAGREVNASYTRHVHNLGFPWNDTNWPIGTWWTAGRYLWACVAESAYYVNEVRRAGCNTGGGMSGGPWMTKYEAVAVSGYVTSVNSGLIYNSKNLYAGRFNSSNFTPLCDSGAADC